MNNTTTSNGILDIIIPHVPQSTPVSVGILILLLVFSVLMVVYLWHRLMTPKGRARRQLLQLQQQVAKATRVENKTIYRIADIIKQADGLTCMTTERVLPDSKQITWEPSHRDFLRQLDQLRYTGKPVSGKELQQIFSEARQWLK